MPTASSAQIYRATSKKLMPITILSEVDLDFLVNMTNRLAMASIKPPIIRKSNSFQSTSEVNCMAMRGIAKIATVTAASQRRILLSIMRSLVVFCLVGLLANKINYLYRFGIQGYLQVGSLALCRSLLALRNEWLWLCRF